MSDARRLPRYPVYVPSRGRAGVALTPRFLIRDGVPFSLVVEPREAEAYGSKFGRDRLLILPWDGDDPVRRAYVARLGIENGGLVAVRNWIKDHASAAGFARHWQIDDNIEYLRRRFRGKRIICDSGVALAAVEDFVDRYENVAVAGLNYQMFVRDDQPVPPFHLNARVYSCTLILNAAPFRWRLRYNDDTDFCLQALAAGYCTVLFNAFMADKKWTMSFRGGNTDELYQGDGRLRMARSLERVWPGVVRTGRRFRRPQHVVRDQWLKFDTPLRLRPGVDLAALPATDEYGMDLVLVKPIRSGSLRTLVADRLGDARPLAPADHHRRAEYRVPGDPLPPVSLTRPPPPPPPRPPADTPPGGPP
jgi:hypothetical protein